MELAASFDEQLSTLAPFVFYVIVGAIVFIETGLLFGFFLPGDSILFSAGLVAAAHGNINIVILVSIILLKSIFDKLLNNCSYTSAVQSSNGACI